MKRRIICLILSAIILCLPLCACGGSSGAANFRVRDMFSREEMTATFKSTDSGKTLEVKMDKSKDKADGDFTEFTCYADPAEYDRVILSSGNAETAELAFNGYVSGWELNSSRFYPYSKDEPKFKRVTFDYQERTKDVLIWTPEDYDAASADKYSVIYMTDGQNLFVRSATSTGSWGVAESALSMADNGGEKCIIVGIENADGHRDDELTPNIGDVLSKDYEDGHGKYFSDFVVNTVMPYVNENYNVYADREHTHVCGSSSGGIESFYIAMEHPDKFASVGALSPAFLLFSDETWVKYLSEKDFSAGYPTVYIYSGNSSSDNLESMICTQSKTMPGNLSKIKYP